MKLLKTSHADRMTCDQKGRITNILKLNYHNLKISFNMNYFIIVCTSCMFFT